MIKYRVTYKGSYLFDCMGSDVSDALDEARKIAKNNCYHSTVISSLVVKKESV